MGLGGKSETFYHECWHFAPENAQGARGARHYAPTRQIDVLHLALDVVPNFTNRSVAGTVSMKFVPVIKSLRELELDAVDLNIQQVTGTVAVQHIRLEKEKLIITFVEPI